MLGSDSKGIIEILLILRTIKATVDPVLTLYSVYGWSAYQLKAVRDSITHLPLHLRKTPTSRPTDKDVDANRDEK